MILKLIIWLVILIEYVAVVLVLYNKVPLAWPKIAIPIFMGALLYVCMYNYSSIVGSVSITFGGLILLALSRIKTPEQGKTGRAIDDEYRG